jgi:hypothetical protein
MISFILSGEGDLDKLTFLYMRNGDRLYRLKTAIEFGERLFPDMTAHDLTGDIYAYRFGSGFERILPAREYDDLVAESKLKEAEYKRELAAYRALSKAERRTTRSPFLDSSASNILDRYIKWTPDSVYYDDIADLVNAQVEAHNRLVIVLQGLIDRSPVFHPHPPWRLWTPDGFDSALLLVYDESRALVSGAAPDFESYRARLNATLGRGSVTVGQDDAWQRQQAVIESARRARDWRSRQSYYERHLDRFRPYGNPGPGLLASVVSVSAKYASFAWTRQRRTGRKVWVPNPKRPGWGWNRKVYDDTTDRVRVPFGELLNVSAYALGDFRQFYADPRTRADYLKWAPLLLPAEDYAAGKRTVGNGRDRVNTEDE